MLNSVPAALLGVLLHSTYMYGADAGPDTIANGGYIKSDANGYGVAADFTTTATQNCGAVGQRGAHRASALMPSG